jgi:hypothetical protein
MLKAVVGRLTQQEERRSLNARSAPRRSSFMDCLRSEYQKASESADEATGIALELSNAHTYLLSRYYRAWSLLHHGKWGELLRIVGERGDGLQMAERNEHKRWAVLFRLELAWLHEQAFDFERARNCASSRLNRRVSSSIPIRKRSARFSWGTPTSGSETRAGVSVFQDRSGPS